MLFLTSTSPPMRTVKRARSSSSLGNRKTFQYQACVRVILHVCAQPACIPTCYTFMILSGPIMYKFSTIDDKDITFLIMTAGITKYEGS